jgi:glycosyltransferase involved in cell wall biosynthesis
VLHELIKDVEPPSWVSGRSEIDRIGAGSQWYFVAAPFKETGATHMDGPKLANHQAGEATNLNEPIGLNGSTDFRGRLREQFDAVVMLTLSDWKTEPRSNRYHFATRFAQHLPVVFVQPILKVDEYHFEPTQVANITLLHIPERVLYEPRNQPTMLGATLLGAALHEKGILCPLLWVYNPYLHHFLRICYSPLKVYHATEDYFDPQMKLTERTITQIKNTIRECDLVVAVTKGVAGSYQRHSEYSGPYVVACNGVDYHYYAESNGGLPRKPLGEQKIAFYQGGINWRLDFGLMYDLMLQLPTWDLVIAGRIHFRSDDQEQRTAWKKLLTLPNCRFLGELSIERLRDEMRRATVGLIPFADHRSLREHSLPLKAFEYVACGLPIVSVPLMELQKHPYRDVFTFATTAGQFAQCIRESAATRFDPEWLLRRQVAARGTSYDQTFDSVCRAIVGTPKQTACRSLPCTILVLFCSGRLLDKNFARKVRSLCLGSMHPIYFAPAEGTRECPYDLCHFDCVVIHSCLDIVGPNQLSPEYRNALRSYPGLKILLVGSEEAPVDFVNEMGIQFVCSEGQENELAEYQNFVVELIKHVEEMVGKGTDVACVASANESAVLPEPPIEFRSARPTFRRYVKKIILTGLRSLFGKEVARTVLHTWISAQKKWTAFLKGHAEE